MPAIVILIGTVLLAIAERMALRVATALGVGVVAFSGVSAMLSTIKANLLAGLTGDIASMLGLLGIGVAINIVFSAYVVRVTLAGLTSDGVLKRFGPK